MNHNPYLLERLAAARRADHMRDADRGRLLSLRRERSVDRPAGVGTHTTLLGPRAWLADVLLRLAAHLDPANRDVRRAVRASTDAPWAT